MNTIGCNEFLNQLGDWMESKRSADARAHLTICGDCRALVTDLAAIQETAPSLAFDDPEPSPRVWLAVRSQLEREGVIRTERHGAAAGLMRWLDDAFAAIPRPALAGAYLVALLALGLAATGPGARKSDDARWLSRMDNSTEPLSAQLDTAEQDTFSSLKNADPVVSCFLAEEPRDC